MSRSSSPFFREYEQKSEVSPLLAGDMTRQTRFDSRLNGTGGSQRKPKPSRTSMPLVYTDFRSPEASRLIPIDTKGTGNKGSQNDDTSSGSQRTPTAGQSHPLKDAINRHSFVTNLESIGSRAVWVILLTPIVLGVVAYFATVPWRYRSWTTPFTNNVVTITAPRALHQAGFVRSFISIPGYTCSDEYCDADVLNMQAHRMGKVSDSLKPVRLLHTHLNLTQYVSAYYTPLFNGSVSTNKTVLVPLPMLRLDSPVYGVNPNDDKIVIEANFVGSRSGGAITGNGGSDSSGSGDSTDGAGVGGNNISNILYADNTHEPNTHDTHGTRLLTATTTATKPSTIEIITSTRTYILTVAILQVLLSLVTLICLLRIVGHIYVNAVQLRDKFATVHTPHSPHGTLHSALSVYDSNDDMLTLDTDRAESSIWHFVLPEQYSAVCMLFFLFLWQGTLPAACVIFYDVGLHVSEGLLFSAGVVTSVAQYGLLFALIVYIDGLKYHATSPYKPRIHSGSTVHTHTYDPFATSTHNSNNTTTYADTHSTDYWRRSTTRVCTFDATTPLQREYKSALALYITYHHPCSIEFVGFLYKKLIMLLLTWVVVVLYWLLYYPRVWHGRLLTQLQYDDVVFRYDVVWGVLLVLSALWGYWIVQVSVSTGLRLRKLKLNASRFRQVAYRTLLFQMQLGLIVLLLTTLYYSYTHDFFVDTAFTTYASLLHYLYAWCLYYGLLHPNIVHSPPLAVHGIEVLLFVTSLVYTIAYCMQPPQQDLNTSKFNIQAFVAMERSLPDYTTTTSSSSSSNPNNNTTANTAYNTYTLHTPNKHAIQHTNKALTKLKQHLIDEEYKQFMNVYLKRVLNNANNKRYFCIESALILLEISYQTYFSVDVLQQRPAITSNTNTGIAVGGSVISNATISSANTLINTTTTNHNNNNITNNNTTTANNASGTHNTNIRTLHTTDSDNSMFSVTSSASGYSTANSPIYSSNTTPRYNTTSTTTSTVNTYTANAAAMFGGAGSGAGTSAKSAGSGSGKGAKNPFFNPFEELENGGVAIDAGDMGGGSNPFGECGSVGDVNAGGSGSGSGGGSAMEGGIAAASGAGNPFEQDEEEGDEEGEEGGHAAHENSAHSIGENPLEASEREGSGGVGGGEEGSTNPFDTSDTDLHIDIPADSGGGGHSRMFTSGSKSGRSSKSGSKSGSSKSGSSKSGKGGKGGVNEQPLTPTNPFEDDYVDTTISASTNTNNANSTNIPTTTNHTADVTTNPFGSDSPENTTTYPHPTTNPAAIPDTAPTPVPQYGPKLNLAGLGYTLRDTFSCEKYTVFGFLATESADSDGNAYSMHNNTTTNNTTNTNTNTNPVQCDYINNKVVVSFRGSLLGNAVTNLKIAQVTLPTLKRPRSYFTKLIREFSSGGGGTTYNKQRSDTLTSDDCDLIRDANIHAYNNTTTTANTNPATAHTTHSAYTPYHDLNASFDYSISSDIQEDYHTLLHRMESQEEENEHENENFVPPETATTAEQLKQQLQNNKLAQNISSVGKNIPIVNQGFKRVHAGFWQSYNSIREEYMRAVVCAIFTHRAQILHTLQVQSNVSPAHSMYIQSGTNTPTNSNRKHNGGNNNNTNSAIKALFGSPLGANNPFSPLFSPSHNTTTNNNNTTTNNNATNAYTPNTPTNATTSAPPSTALEVVFCGHSLGAAIASLAAFELSENIKPIMEALAMEAVFNVPKSTALHTLPLLYTLPAPVVSLYMYGAPRVGNSVFATTLNKKIDNIYRMQVNGDVVTMLPKFVGFYRHAGTAVLLDDKERGNLIIQPSIIESSMLQYYTGNVHNHSLDKYRACLEACLEPAELTEYLTREYQNLHSSTANGGVGVMGGISVGGDGSSKYGSIGGSINGTVGGGVRGSRRVSISKSDIPEWMVSNAV